MDGSDVNIIRHFEKYCELDDDDRTLLTELERHPMTLTAGELLWEEHQAIDAFCLLRKGWAYSYRSMNDGTRQVLDVYLPGDVIGLREFSFQRRLSSVAMLTEASLGRFNHRYLIGLFGSSHRATALFFSMLAGQQALLTERLVNIGRRNAREKLAHFICEMYMRLKRVYPELPQHFHMPLSQQMLADILGLSSVHVSRTFSELREAGLVYRDRNRIEIPDPEALIEATQFSDHYLRERVADHLFESGKPWPETAVAAKGSPVGQGRAADPE
ncbi:CRP-like cAMP-binding protein [Kushneria sinocarnis]|uniref:CRP-like cAMP-binding protein n=1 Tax=Kushneria sinocarnis TaxID=595502 RepID=A0A420WZ51_9GAMM|nr:Crp/Fnr family transcriptional regulator [Kushneria sinocarnis]RKR06557.1 CRP-like cAMP-binding protein [Kushneria sinocarnis]